MKTLFRWLAILLLAISLVGCAYAKHMDKGDTYFEEGQYEKALEEYQAAKEIDPGSKEVAKKIDLTKEKLVGKYKKEADSALASNDYMGAIIAAGRAHMKLPESKVVRQLVRNVSESVQREADQRLTNNDYAGALQLLEGIFETLPPEQVVVESRIEQVKAQWGESVVKAAKTAETAGRKGEALLMYAKAHELTGNQAYADKRDQFYAEVVLANTYVIAPEGRGDRYEAVMANVPKRKDNTTLAVLGPEEEAGVVHAEMRVRLSRVRYDKNRRKFSKTAQYQSGTKQVPNPAYQRKKDEISREERDLTSYENDVTRLQSDVERYRADVQREGDTPNTTTGAEQNLSNAQSRLESARRKVVDQRNRVQRLREDLSRTDQFKEEPVYADHAYEVTEHKLTAYAELTVLVDHEDGRPPITVEKRVATTATDLEHIEQPIANVAADPLELPSREELAQQLYQQAGQIVEQTVSRSFQGWREKKLAEAKAAPTDGERVNKYVVYAITNPAKVAPEVVDEISRLRGVPNLTEVLAR